MINQLKEKRKELRLTQAESAILCGVSRRTYQTYEEQNVINDVYNELLNKLNELGIINNENIILSKRKIKELSAPIFLNYKEIQCVYLFGSYARGEATSKSDIDFLIILNQPMGMKYFGISSDLEEALNKKVDTLTLEQIINNESLLKDILCEGIKIYGWQSFLRIESLIRHIEIIQTDLKNVSLEQFKHNDLLVRATSFSISQIGENMSKIEEKIGLMFPDLPWKYARNMRNILIHDYDNANPTVVYLTAKNDLDELYVKFKDILMFLRKVDA